MRFGAFTGAMGSPLGILFAEIYMAKVEERTFKSTEKPNLYVRYRDDIFTIVINSAEIETLSSKLTECSILNFTIERSQEKCLPYLDVFVEQTPSEFRTKVYTKATNAGRCLNARGECSDNYKRLVIHAYARRALTHSSNWEEVDKENERIRQLLTNN